MNYAKANTPVRYKKPAGSVFRTKGHSSQTVVYEGLALVKHLLDMGLKEEAVRAHHAHKAAQSRRLAELKRLLEAKQTEQ